MKIILASLFALLVSPFVYGDADWLSPGGMTKVMEGVDDGTFHVPLGHAFPYYGGVFTDAWMSSNGVIILYDPVNQFGNPNTRNSMCCSGQDLSNNNYGGQFSFMLAPLWTDLRDANLTPDDGYYYKTNEDVSSFLWYNVTEYGTTNKNTFQANLWPDGSFDFLYDEVDITRHNTFIGFTGNVDYGEVNQLGYYQGSVTEFDIDFHNQTVNGGRAWYGNDGGYEASLDCSNTLNDPNCPGYEQAYYEQQCSYDALYDFGCQGYEQAYFDLQCSYDEMYDTMCPGYDNAILVQNLSGQDFVFGDDVSDFYETEPIVETDVFPLYEEQTNMFTSYEEETNMFTEPEIYEEPVEQIYFEEPVEETFFEEPVIAAVEEEVYEEVAIEEVVAEEHGQNNEEIAHIEDDIGNSEEELPMTEVDVSGADEEIAAELSREIIENEVTLDSTSSSPVSIDAVSIALDTAATSESVSLSLSAQQNESSLTSSGTSASADTLSVSIDQNVSSSLSLSVQQYDSSIYSTDTFATDSMVNQAEDSASQVITIVEERSSSQVMSLQSFSASVALVDDMQGAVSDTISQDLEVNDSEIALYDNSTFGSIDSAFGDATLDTILDPSLTAIEISSVQVVSEQSAQEESTLEIQIESSTVQTDTGFGAQQDQSFSTGQSITAVLNNVAPNFSKFDVAPPSQQEQKTTEKAESQADSMSEEQLANNLDEFSDELKDSGGFTDQSLTVFLMGRNSGFSQYSNVQLQDNPFYDDKGMPGGNVQNDRRGMLQLIGTDNRHKELVSLQYGR